MNRLIPKTQYGNYSGGLLLAFVLFFLMAQIAIMSGQRGGDTFFDNLWISMPMLLAFLSIFLSMVLGAISIIKDHERSPIIFTACIIGLLITIFVLGEFLYPH